LTTLDTKLIPKIFNLVERLGKNVTFETGESEPVDYDPDTGHTTYDTPDSYTRKVTPPEAYENYFIDDDLIKAGDTRVYLPAKDLTFTPELEMKVTIDSIDWVVVNIETIYTGGSVALYELQLRR
jgi:hypothetical protein